MRDVFGNSNTKQNVPLSDAAAILKFVKEEVECSVNNYQGNEILKATGAKIVSCLPGFRLVLRLDPEAAEIFN